MTIKIYKNWMDELMKEIEETLSEIPYIDKLMELNGIGIKTVIMAGLSL